MTKKELTHIYHEVVVQSEIAIGQDNITDAIQLELFQKALVLTSDIKRLPYLLGGKLMFDLQPRAIIAMNGSNVDGIRFVAVLFNGFYEADQFEDMLALYADEKATNDIMMSAYGYILRSATANPTVMDIQTSHWDFEGKKILYDTISLLLFLEVDTNVSTTVFDVGIKAMFELEVDWQPVNKAELQEFLMEHIYAQQGD